MDPETFEADSPLPSPPHSFFLSVHEDVLDTVNVISVLFYILSVASVIAFCFWMYDLLRIANSVEQETRAIRERREAAAAEQSHRRADHTHALGRLWRAADAWDRSRRLRAIMAALPVVDYGSHNETSRCSECAICLEDFKDGERCRVFPECNHGFHAVCIDPWLMYSDKCPLCRHPV